MDTIDVVIADVGSDLSKCVGMPGVVLHRKFGFDRSEATFHECVVVAVACRRHALTHRSSDQHCSISLGGVLAATVAVMDQTVTGTSCLDGHRQRFDYQLFGHRLPIR